MMVTASGDCHIRVQISFGLPLLMLSDEMTENKALMELGTMTGTL